MTTIDYEEHKQYLNWMSLKFHTNTGIPFKELLSEANWIFLTAKKNFDNKKNAKFSTWLTLRLQWDLSRFAKKWKAWNQFQLQHNKSMPMFATIVDRPQELELYIKESIQQLSEVAQIIVEILLNEPAITLNLKGGESPLVVRQALKKYLTNTYFQDEYQCVVNKTIKNAYNELCDFVATI